MHEREEQNPDAEGQQDDGGAVVTDMPVNPPQGLEEEDRDRPEKTEIQGLLDAVVDLLQEIVFFGRAKQLAAKLSAAEGRRYPQNFLRLLYGDCKFQRFDPHLLDSA